MDWVVADRRSPDGRGELMLQRPEAEIRPVVTAPFRSGAALRQHGLIRGEPVRLRLPGRDCLAPIASRRDAIPSMRRLAAEIEWLETAR